MAAELFRRQRHGRSTDRRPLSKVGEDARLLMAAALGQRGLARPRCRKHARVVAARSPAEVSVGIHTSHASPFVSSLAPTLRPSTIARRSRRPGLARRRVVSDERRAGRAPGVARHHLFGPLVRLRTADPARASTATQPSAKAEDRVQVELGDLGQVLGRAARAGGRGRRARRRRPAARRGSRARAGPPCRRGRAPRRRRR